KFNSYVDAEKYFSGSSADYILCGNIPYDEIALLKNYFPKLIEAKKGFTYEFFVYGKTNSADSEITDLNFSDTINFHQPSAFWNINTSLSQQDSAIIFDGYFMDSSREFSPTFSAWLYDVMKSRDDILMVDFK